MENVFEEMREYEICVACKRETNIPRKTPIEERRFYVEGVGQLDKECYGKIYETKNQTRRNRE